MSGLQAKSLGWMSSHILSWSLMLSKETNQVESKILIKILRDFIVQKVLDINEMKLMLKLY